jgi:hypothetical protein
MSGNISKRDQNILWGRSGNRCALSECRKILVVNKTPNDRESIIGEMAHIKGEKLGAARYDPKMTDKERSCYDNRILLCGNHHTMIDDQRNTYTVEKLHEIKRQHEAWVESCTEKEMVNVTFAELEVITKFLKASQQATDDSLTIIPLKDKIKKNELSAKSERLIKIGLLQVKQVGDYIEKCLDIEFGERLKQGFVEEYGRLRNQEHLKGDDLFESLTEFASQGRTDFKERAAGLAVLTYLFENCEVFVK